MARPVPQRTASAAAPSDRHTPNDLAYAAVIGGIASGAVMLGFLVANAARADLPALRPLVLTAAMFGGDVADPGAATLVLAGLLWAAVSVALALIYAAVVPRDFPFASAAMIGVGYVFFVIVAMSSWILPWLNPSMRAGIHDTGGAWVLGYFFFGVALGMIPALRRRLVSLGEARQRAASNERKLSTRAMA